MSINNSHYGRDGVLLYNGEVILIYYDGVELSLDPNASVPIMKDKKKGRIYLTSHRVVFVNKSHNDVFQSFSMPFMCMRNLDIEQPVFGANFIKGEVKSEPQGRWEGIAKFKIKFNDGGAIEFGKCILHASRLSQEHHAVQQMRRQAANTARQSNVYPAPPPAYTALSSNTYGWVPIERFPTRPQGENVFMNDQPPPYAGIFSEQTQHTFDEKNKLASGAETNGFVDPSKPDKMYLASSAPPEPDCPPPSYAASMEKKND